MILDYPGFLIYKGGQGSFQEGDRHISDYKEEIVRPLRQRREGCGHKVLIPLK